MNTNDQSGRLNVHVQAHRPAEIDDFRVAADVADESLDRGMVERETSGSQWPGVIPQGSLRAGHGVMLPRQARTTTGIRSAT